MQQTLIEIDPADQALLAKKFRLALGNNKPKMSLEEIANWALTMECQNSREGKASGPDFAERFLLTLKKLLAPYFDGIFPQRELRRLCLMVQMHLHTDEQLNVFFNRLVKPCDRNAQFEMPPTLNHLLKSPDGKCKVKVNTIDPSYRAFVHESINQPLMEGVTFNSIWKRLGELYEGGVLDKTFVGAQSRDAVEKVITCFDFLEGLQ